MFKEKIIFLDFDGVLNKHDVTSVNDDRAILPECIAEINHILGSTFAQIVIISNWAQIFTFEQLSDRLYKKGLLENAILDSIKVKELNSNGNLVNGLEKDKFINDYINDNKIENYVIIDDNINSTILDETKIVKTGTFVGITKEDSQKAIKILNNTNEFNELQNNLYKLGEEVFGDKKYFTQWLNSENFYFDNKKPIEWTNSMEGLKFINDRLIGMQYGDNA